MQKYLSIFITVALLLGPLQFSYAQSGKLVFRIDKIDKLTHHLDQGYSLIEGRTITGKHFNIKAVWGFFIGSCPKWITKFKDGELNMPKKSENDPAIKYKHYILDGTVDGSSPITLQVSTCVASEDATKFKTLPEWDYN